MSEESFTKHSPDRDYIIFGLLLLAGSVIYFRLTAAAFINLDDNLYVYDNPYIRDGLNLDSIRWAFTAFHSANWHPLTWLSHALDISLFGLNAGSHHSVNILLHLVNAVLSFVVFRKMTGRMWESAAIAALFLVHPAHVESVAWVSERKDVLSTLFWLLTIYAYTRWVREDGELWSPKYLLTVGLFALGLMAKPMLVTLPFVLLLCDLWPLRRISSPKEFLKVFLEKAAFFALTIGSSILTYLAQRSGGAVETLDALPLADRLTNALLAYAKYVVMLVYPVGLGVWYPYERDFSVLHVAGSAILIIAVSAVSISQIRKRPYLVVGWFWFLGTLVPVIGIVQVGSQSLADRYTYVPYFGLFIMIAFGAADAFERYKVSPRTIGAGAGIILLALSAVAFRQVGFWRDHEALYMRTLSVTRNNYLVAHNLCHHLAFADRLDEAERYCQEAVSIKPDYFEVYNTMGVIASKRFDFAAAERDFSRALELKPNYSLGYSNLAVAQAQQGKAEEAERSLQKSLAYSGDVPNQSFPAILNEIAGIYAGQKRFDKAVDNYRRQLSLTPNDLSAQAELATALFYRKEYDEAEKWAANVIAVDQNSPIALNVLGLVSMQKGRYADAALAFRTLVAVAPDFPGVKDNLDRANAATNNGN